MINYGKEYGKLCVVLNVINNNQALVTGPKSKSGVLRKKINMKWLTVTELTIDIFVDQRDVLVEKAWEKAGIDAKWKETALCKRISQRNTRSKMNDFQKFKVKLAQKERAKLIRQELKALKA